jgi:hypothetical protein
VSSACKSSAAFAFPLFAFPLFAFPAFALAEKPNMDSQQIMIAQPRRLRIHPFCAGIRFDFILLLSIFKNQQMKIFLALLDQNQATGKQILDRSPGQDIAALFAVEAKAPALDHFSSLRTRPENPGMVA